MQHMLGVRRHKVATQTRWIPKIKSDPRIQFFPLPYLAIPPLPLKSSEFPRNTEGPAFHRIVISLSIRHRRLQGIPYLALLSIAQAIDEVLRLPDVHPVDQAAYERIDAPVAWIRPHLGRRWMLDLDQRGQHPMEVCSRRLVAAEPVPVFPEVHARRQNHLSPPS